MDFPIIAVLAATLTIATPLVFGGLGALLGERTGVLNLGIEERCTPVPSSASWSPRAPTRWRWRPWPQSSRERWPVR